MKRGGIRMAKVSMHLGFTFRIGELSTNQYARVDLNVDQIDTEVSVDTQLAEVKDKAAKIWDFIQGEVDNKIEAVLDAGSNA